MYPNHQHSATFNHSHSTLGGLKVGLRWLLNAYSSHSIHGGGSSPQNQGGQIWAARGPVPRMQGGGSTIEPGGILEVAMLGFDIAGSNTQLCCWSSYTGHRDRFKESYWFNVLGGSLHQGSSKPLESWTHINSILTRKKMQHQQLIFQGGEGHSIVKLNIMCSQKTYTFGKLHH